MADKPPIDVTTDALITLQKLLQSELDTANQAITDLQAQSAAQLAGWTARRDKATASLAELAAFQATRKP